MEQEKIKSYNITFTENVLCDILIVGGGGGGGSGGYENGGGGGGGVLYMTSKLIQSGITYKIRVGDGGANNTSGYDSAITYNDDTDVSYDNIILVGKGGVLVMQMVVVVEAVVIDLEV